MSSSEGLKLRLGPLVRGWGVAQGCSCLKSSIEGLGTKISESSWNPLLKGGEGEVVQCQSNITKVQDSILGTKIPQETL